MKSRRRTRLNAKLYAMTLEEMAEGPSTRQELCAQTGLSRKTVEAIVRALHQRRLIHVASWEQDALGRFTVPAFKFGRGKDTVRPAPKTGAELARGYKARRAQREALMASAAPIPASSAQQPGA